MAFDGNGNYNLPVPEFPAVAGEYILASDFNTIMQDIATALSKVLVEDGQQPLTANLPAGGKKITGLAAGTSPGDAIRYEQGAKLVGSTFTGLVNLAAGADIASAATIDLTVATGNCPRITGTTPTSAVTMNAGQQMIVVANEAWPLTYHATTNKLNIGESYTCVAGDVVRYHKDLSGVVHGTIFPVSPWSDYSATSTIVGWSSFTFKEIYTRKIGSMLFVNYRLQGTSNATGVTFTVPYSIDALTYSTSAYIIDNGSAQTAPGWMISASASATITVYKDMSGAAFTDSGTKAVRGQFFVHIA